jgi:ATP/maltotriose-dependent transcriptional regulator MalT
MTEIVETPNTQLQKVTLLVQMTEFEPDEGDLDAGEWLLNVLMSCANENKPYSHYGAQAYLKAAQVLKVENCDVVVSNGL